MPQDYQPGYKGDDKYYFHNPIIPNAIPAFPSTVQNIRKLSKFFSW